MGIWVASLNGPVLCFVCMPCKNNVNHGTIHGRCTERNTDGPTHIVSLPNRKRHISTVNKKIEEHLRRRKPNYNERTLLVSQNKLPSKLSTITIPTLLLKSNPVSPWQHKTNLIMNINCSGAKKKKKKKTNVLKPTRRDKQWNANCKPLQNRMLLSVALEFV